MPDLIEQFGQIDIYLFDQLLRGRLTRGMRVLDAGCGGGRNLVYLLREGFEVFGVDQDLRAIEEVRRWIPAMPTNRFQVRSLERLNFADGFFDFVISNAVLHFAQDDKQFRAMLAGMWRVVKPGGILFCRLASSIGMPKKQLQRIEGRRFLLPDGSDRYLVDEKLLETLTRELAADLVDPIKTTVVQNQRCMTTWILRKVG